jgi:hypothetical protein
MGNKYSETVKFNRDLHVKYEPNLIDFLKVYNPSEKKMTMCEHWGYNDEGENNLPYYDFGMIADFHFDISKNETKFYFGDEPIVGFYKSKHEDLICLPVGKSLTTDFVVVSTFKFDQKYPVPNTMWDLAKFIDNFLYCRKHYFEEQRSQHNQKMSETKSTKQNDCCLDLPF